MSKGLRIIVGGFLGLLPAGGVTWDYIQYPLGFVTLGHDVYYIEDTCIWPIYQDEHNSGVSCAHNVAHIASVMESFGLSNRWAYRDEATGQWFGLSAKQVDNICQTADIFINISCSTVMRDKYREIPLRALIDSDPMFTQIQYVTECTLTHSKSSIREMVHAHTHHFTFGENIRAKDCRIPDCGLDWIPTRQPICLAHWPITPLPINQQTAYSTIMNWTAAHPLAYEGETWGQKDVEFLRYMTLPTAFPTSPLSVAVGQTTGNPFPTAAAQHHGWQILNPTEHLPNWRSYQTFIQQSRGEFSVAKETYVKARTGWFSCRSACYLASGRPVVTQDTGWSHYLPHGQGLFAFYDRESAIEGLNSIEADPYLHAKAARQIAEEYFDSNYVLNKLLNQLGV
ncbi:MAG: glycosyltransferase [Leptolyngbyaceae cyanobacterium]